MAVLFLIACLTLVAVSGKNLQDSADSFYHYNHVSKPDPSATWDFASHLNDGEDVVPGDVVPSGPDFNSGDSEDYSWGFSPLENNNKDYLYDYVGDNWLSGEDSPYYYNSEGKSNKEKTDEELPSKHWGTHRWSRSLANNHKRNSGFNNFNSLPEVRPARKTPQFESNRMRRSIKLRTPNFLMNAENVHPTGDLQFIPTMLKREARLRTTATAKSIPGHRLSVRKRRRREVKATRATAKGIPGHRLSVRKRRRREVKATRATGKRIPGHRLSGRKRRRREVTAHQLEYFTDNDGDSQFHAPGKAEGTEWDLVPLEALKDDNEQELGIQYDKKVNDASLLISE